MSDSETSKGLGRRDVAEDDDGLICVADGVNFGATPVAKGTTVKTWKALGHKCRADPVAELRLLQGGTLAGWVRRLPEGRRQLCAKHLARYTVWRRAVQCTWVDPVTGEQC